MIDIRTINSEVEIQKEIIRNFKRYRLIDQIAFYLGKGASYYYNPNKKFSGQQYDYPKVIELLEDILTRKREQKIAIVSLGCGYCEKDKKILCHLQGKGYNFSFFGVDSSMAMIQKARSVLNNATFEAHLICADFGGEGFAEEIGDIIGDYDLGIYLFLGNTFGNLNQSYIVDVLNNILQTGDYMLLDIVGFEAITHNIQLKLFKRYLHYIKNPPDVDFRLEPIKILGIPEDCGKLTLEVNSDDTTQASVFKFGFKVNKLTKFYLVDPYQPLLGFKILHLSSLLRGISKK